MKKYITVAALLAAATACANAEYSLELDSSYYTNPNAWVYVWSGNGGDSSWDTGLNWMYYESVTDTESASAAGSKPVNADSAFIGYTFEYKDGKQILTANTSAVTVSVPTWMGGSGRVFLGSNVTLSGVSNGFSGSQKITFNFGDFSGTSLISMADFWMQNGANVCFAGDITMSEDTFSYDVFTSSRMEQMGGTWNAESVSVVDAKGNSLVYADEGSGNVGKAGYYWVETSKFEQGAEYTVSIKAVALPEPSAFGMLAGLGALALVASRRRRVKKA